MIVSQTRVLFHTHTHTYFFNHIKIFQFVATFFGSQIPHADKRQTVVEITQSNHFRHAYVFGVVLSKYIFTSERNITTKMILNISCGRTGLKGSTGPGSW